MLAKIGSISHGTLRNEDLLEAFINTLEELDDKKWFEELIRQAKETNPESEYADDLVNEELPDALNSFVPDYVYFGAHPGDGSDFGFWPDYERVENETRFGEIVKGDSYEDILDKLGVNEYVVIVNDHGNMTLYRVKIELEEVWSVV